MDAAPGPGQAGQGAAQQAPQGQTGAPGRAFQATPPSAVAAAVAARGARSRPTPDHRHRRRRLQHARPPARRPSPPGPPHPFRLHRATHAPTNPRLSMSLPSESDSEPDLSLLAVARRGAGPRLAADAMAYHEAGGHDDDEVLSQEHYDMDDTSIDDQADDQADDPADDQDTAPLFDPAAVGLKEISNLGKFTVSSHKPGCGVDELRSDDLKLCWQSDGPQPHKLTVYFVKRVGIRDIRFFVDYNEDESYTPTKMVFKSGTSENSLIEFATMNLDSPVGWQQVPLAGAGGDPDGNTLVSYVLQMQVLENHQNGKDTHLRGFKIYALDADGDGAGPDAPPADRFGDVARALAAARLASGDAGGTLPDFMREPEIR